MDAIHRLKINILRFEPLYLGMRLTARKSKAVPTSNARSIKIFCRFSGGIRNKMTRIVNPNARDLILAILPPNSDLLPGWPIDQRYYFHLLVCISEILLRVIA